MLSFMCDLWVTFQFDLQSLMLCMNANEVCTFDMNYGIDDYVCLDSWHIYILRKEKEIEYI